MAPGTPSVVFPLKAPEGGVEQAEATVVIAVIGEDEDEDSVTVVVVGWTGWARDDS